MAETITSRTTDTGETLLLKRRPTDRRENAQYEYYVTESGSNSRLDRYEFTREDGLAQLRETKESYERADEAESQRGQGPSLPGGIGGGLGGGGKPSVPGFGMDNDDDEDDGGPFLPGF